MEMFLGFLVLLACLIVGVRHGGIGLAVISGIGLVVYTFIFGYKPGNPPIDVMLTILAVVTCAGFLQTQSKTRHNSCAADDVVFNGSLRYRSRRLYDVPDYLRHSD